MSARPILGSARVTADRGAVALSSTAALIDAIGHARSVTLEGYALHPGALVRSLERAASIRHADVHVVVSPPYSDPTGEVERGNERAVRELRAGGVDVVMSAEYDHLKAAIVDGRLFLDDRNWTMGGGDTVVVDTRPQDVEAASQAMAGEPSRPSADFATHKRKALRLEQDLIESGSRTIDLESENISNGPLVDALERAAQHAHVRLVVSRRELVEQPAKATTLDELQRDGVDVHVGEYVKGVGSIGNEKFCVAGDRAWVGSANASWSGSDDPSDWGLVTADAKLIGTLNGHFERDWQLSKAFVAADYLDRKPVPEMVAA